MRQFVVGLLLLIGGVALVAANLMYWLDRTVFDEGGFVATFDGIFKEPAVENALAHTLSSQLVDVIDINGLVQRLPAGAGALAPAATTAAQSRIEDVTRRVIDSDAADGVLSTALLQTHRQVTAILGDDHAAVQSNGDQLVLDVQESLRSILGSLGVPVPGVVESALAKPTQQGVLPGQVVLVKDAGFLRIAAGVTRYQQDALHIAAGIAAGAFVLALLLAKSKRSALVGIGFYVALGGLLLLGLIFVGGFASTHVGGNVAATGVVYDDLVAGLHEQAWYCLVGGGALFIAALVLRLLPLPSAGD